MEVENVESCESPVKKVVEPEEIDQKIDKYKKTNPEPTEKILDCDDTVDNGACKSSDSSNEKSPEVSFKKPPLIGPLRGKRAQSRIQSCSSSAGNVEHSVTVEKAAKDTENGEESKDRVKISISDDQQLSLQYREPSWAGEPHLEYKMEILKSGMILDVIDLHKKSCHVIGRLPTCDISLAHPTISRYHAILQYRALEEDKHPKGFYLYDLGSTHGSFWNGCKVRPKTYVRLQGGHMIRFGCSQRKFILQTPPDEVEEESELSVTELKEKRRTELLERERLAREEREQEEEAERLRIEKEENEGINWGMGEDADEDTDLTENPYASTNNEELFLDDPKKTLRGWFEREGHELQYEVEEKGIGQFLCWVNLPIDGVGCRTVRAEALVKGKKKESVIQCALEACRILDRHGVLRQATHEARKRKTRNWEEEDFYDSDEDNFLDRTGTVEKKREQRMRQAGKLEEKVETYASLLEKHTTITKRITDIENRLKKSQKLKADDMETSNEDALDAFMSNLNSTILNKADLAKMRLELQNLRKEQERILKLVNITRPANLPSLTSPKSSKTSNDIPNLKDNATLSRTRSIDCEVAVEKSSPKKRIVLKDEINEEATKEKGENVDFTKSEDSIEILTEEESSSAKSSTNEEPISNEEALITNVECTEKSDMEIVKKKKKNMKRMQQRAEKAAKDTQKVYNDDAYDEDYSMWLPPQNQSGDGKTNLNEKYGY